MVPIYYLCAHEDVEETNPSFVLNGFLTATATEILLQTYVSLVAIILLI